MRFLLNQYTQVIIMIVFTIDRHEKIMQFRLLNQKYFKKEKTGEQSLKSDGIEKNMYKLRYALLRSE